MIIDSMVIKKISVAQFLTLWERMKDDFPSEEWIDLELVKKGFESGQIAAYSLADKCIALVIEREEVALLFYLWSDSAYRSLGLGSKMLKQLQDRYRLVLGEVETADENSGNYQRQLARIRFYQKNGFIFNDFYVLINGIRCSIISSADTSSEELSDHMHYFYTITYENADQAIKFV